MRIFESNDCFGNVRALERRDFWLRWSRRAALAIVGAAILFGGYRGYGARRERHLARQTREFFDQRDYSSAVLVARRVLELNPDNVAACRVMAETAELAGKSDAVTWRKRVAALAPAPANSLALAATALRFGQAALAGNVLDRLAPAERTGAKFHQIAGALALSEKQMAAAESHFAAAVQVEPANVQLRLNLASVRLALPDAAANENARADLAGLAEQPATRLAALRALVSDALAHNARSSAERWASQLKEEKEAAFSDALLYLEAAQNTDAAEVALTETQSRARESSSHAASLITWMNRRGMAAAGLAWALALPQQILEGHPVPLAIAESYSFLQDWKGLAAWVGDKSWGEHECFRLAVESHALHHLSVIDRPSTESQTIWRAALKAANNRAERLAAIAQLAEGWGYTEDAEEAWWLIANGNESAREALAALQRLYKSKQNTHGLLRVAKRALELNPADLVAENNCASLGLLLTGDNSARRLAARLHNAYPDNAAFTATYAFAMHLEGKTSDALKALESLPENQLRIPALAAYYFVILVENGNMERAHSFLSAANRAALLPEEQQLLTAATRKLLNHDARAAAKSVAVAN